MMIGSSCDSLKRNLSWGVDNNANNAPKKIKTTMDLTNKNLTSSLLTSKGNVGSSINVNNSSLFGASNLSATKNLKPLTTNLITARRTELISTAQKERKSVSVSSTLLSSSSSVSAPPTFLKSSFLKPTSSLTAKTSALSLNEDRLGNKKAENVALTAREAKDKKKFEPEAKTSTLTTVEEEFPDYRSVFRPLQHEEDEDKENETTSKRVEAAKRLKKAKVR